MKQLSVDCFLSCLVVKARGTDVAGLTSWVLVSNSPLNLEGRYKCISSRLNLSLPQTDGREVFNINVDANFLEGV